MTAGRGSTSAPRASSRAPTSASPPSPRKRFGGSLAGTITLTAGLGGMGGAQPLAVTMNGGVAICVDVDPAADRAPAATPGTSTGSPPTWTRPRPLRRPGRPAGAVDRRVRQRRRRGARPARPASSPPTSSPTRPRRTTRSSTCPPGCAARRRRPPPADPDELPRAGRDVDGRATARPWSRSPSGAPRCSTTATACGPRPGRRVRRRLRLPRLPPRLHPPAVLRGQGPVPLGGPVRRPGRHRRHRPGGPRGVPRRRRPGPVDPHGPASASRSRASRPASAGWATANGPGSALRFNEHGGTGEVSAPIVIGRDHLDSGVGGLAVPGDGSDGRRQRRHRRLADPQRPAQHRQRRLVGQLPPRRRGGDRPVDPRRHGGRGRRHAAGRREAGAGAHHRPGHRAWSAMPTPATSEAVEVAGATRHPPADGATPP